MPESRRTALRLQAAYYVATGAFPFVSRRAFEAVTGPKTDWWLVQMVGLLAVTVGTAIALETREPQAGNATCTLAVLSAFSFAGIDVAYATSGRISKIYLADAAIESRVRYGNLPFVATLP